MMISSDQAAATEKQVAAIGMGVFSDESIAAGVASVPTPITEMASDFWFFYQLLMARESRLTDLSQPAEVFETDSKAMRKVDVGQDLGIIGEFSSQGGGVVVTIGGRMLIKVN